MGRIADVTFLSEADGRERTAVDLSLFYVIRGGAEIRGPDTSLSLSTADILSVNPGEPYALTIYSGVTAVVRFHHEEVYALLGGQPYLVHCSSAGVRDGSFDAVRFQVQSLLSSLLEEEFGPVAFEKNSASLLLALLTGYAVKVGAENRKQEVSNWIENTCKEAVTLEDAAERYHLTPQYFSRWFSDQFGCPFLKYLSRVRCRNARRDLVETRSSILRIALEHGFPNAASFSRSFSEEYGETPLQYRKTHGLELEAGVLSVRDVAAYLEQERGQEQIPKVIVPCGARRERLVPYWNTLCNLGNLSGLSHLEVQNQVRQLQIALPFHQARVFLRHEGEADSGFYQEDQAFGFLSDLGISPLFVVDAGRGQRDGLPWLREFVRHIRYRFGFRKFCLELLAPAEEQDVPAYCGFVREIRDLFREARTECRLLGPGIPVTGDGGGLSALLREKPDLDEITIRCGPRGMAKPRELQMLQTRTMAEPDYLLHQYLLARELTGDWGCQGQLLVTSWKNSLSDRDALNDSSWAAARIVRTALTGYGTLPSLPLAHPLDILADGSRNRGAFQGREGLMTVNHLRKPSFYAFRFLKHLDEYFLYKDEHMIVSASYEDYFQIVIQNGCPLSFQYCLHEAADGPIPETFFEARDPFHVTICLTGLGDRQWMVKTRVVNETVGNVWQAWLSMNYHDPSFMGRDEQELLRAKSLPDISGTVLASHDGVLEVPASLAPNEIRHIHLIPIR